jgi:hypothetical protein
MASEEQKKVLTAADITRVRDVVIKPVEIPEWGGVVNVRSMSALERENYFEAIRKIEGYGKKERTIIVLKRSSALLAQMTLCDEAGNLLFTPQEIATLSAKSSKALQRIVDVSAKLNGLADDDDESAGKDSPEQMASGSGSSSGSPDTSERLAALSSAS